MTNVDTKPGRLGFGMQLPIQARSKLLVDPWENDAGPEELARIATACDSAGFRYIAVCDHVAVPRDQAERMQTAWYDTVATLGWLAAMTTNVQLLSHVFIVAYRHPLVTAKSFMTLDQLSGGRAILGIGAGHVEGEFDVLGVPYDQRGTITDQAVDVLRAAFDEEYPDVETALYSVHDVGLAPRPIQAHLPIWVGGSSKPALRRAAQRADGWLPQGPPPEGMASAIAYLHAERERLGREGPFDIGGSARPLYVGDPGWDIGEHAVSGKPDELAAMIREWASVGATQLQLRFRCRDVEELLDQIARFGAEVLPLTQD